MARTFECDGCGKTENYVKASGCPEDIKVCSVTLCFGDKGSVKTWAYDLCTSCQGHLESEANPTTWPRQAKPEE